MHVERIVEDRVATRIAQAGIDPNDRLIVVHVSAGNPFRRWPIGAFAAVVRALASGERNRRVIVTSGPSDREAAGLVIATARALLPPDEQHRVVVCGEFALDELRALLEHASLYIGGDSGPLHVASTTAVPIVGLYGPTLPARSAPWRPAPAIAEAVEVLGLPCRPCDQRICVPGDFRCLTSIQPGEVIEAAERALSQHI
jgi:ADP-heptose:LPS heptosyltransferase